MPQAFRGAKDFRDLEVWKWCRQLRKDIETQCRSLPPNEQRRLADQMIRAARSVTANLAEGFGRYHYQDSIQRFLIARGSLFELLDHLVVAADNSHLSPSEFKVFEGQIQSGLKLLNGYVAYLRKRRDGPRSYQSTSKPMNQ